MKNLSKIVFNITLAFSFLILPVFVSAQATYTQGSVDPSPYFNNLFPPPTGTSATGGSGSGGLTLNSTSSTCTTGGIGGLICQIQQILNSIVPVLLALGMVYFVWGVVQYMIADGEEAKTKGRDTVIFGVIGLACIVGVWGLVGLIVNTFNLSATAPSLTPLTGTSLSCSAILGSNPLLQNLLSYVTCILNNSVIPLIFALAVVYFVWGVVQYMIADGEEAKTKGKDVIIYGVIALVVMISVWGLVRIVGTTFGLNTSVLPHVTP